MQTRGIVLELLARSAKTFLNHVVSLDTPRRIGGGPAPRAPRRAAGAHGEVWRQKSGELVPIRVTHVLRAKVSSPENRERGIYLFNTWQQYGDGRKRTRKNGLLSEKLCICEMPLEQNLHAVCSRAVVEEEMAFVVDSTVKVLTGKPPPAYDPDYKCPLQVVGEDFIEHTIEIETSKSYPGLMTMYHLYTVDIVCSGLPTVDFNTLEFEHATGKDL
ncbi:unnamed protein product, partial [Prorocentrum cordatum]